MFGHKTITLRPLEFQDIDALYNWETDHEIQVFAGWTRPLSRDAFREKQTRRITQPSDDLIVFAVEYEQRLVGYVQLALIDRVARRAAVGIVIGDKSVWSKGVGTGALILLLDYRLPSTALSASTRKSTALMDVSNACLSEWGSSEKASYGSMSCIMGSTRICVSMAC